MTLKAHILFEIQPLILQSVLLNVESFRERLKTNIHH